MECLQVLVVNCFRSLNLWYLPQPWGIAALKWPCCELLSFFEFMIFATTLWTSCLTPMALWIAFVLWIYDICHNLLQCCCWYSTVVNCFRSLNLWYLPQLMNYGDFITYRCELLSFFEFMIFATTFHLPTSWQI